MYSVPDPERCGIVYLGEDQRVIDFVEKTPVPRSNLAFAGIMIGTQELLDAIPRKREADLAFDVLPRLVGRMRAYPIPDYLLDIGTRENYEVAQRTWPGFSKNNRVEGLAG